MAKSAIFPSGLEPHFPYGGQVRVPDMIRLVAAAAAIGATCSFLSRPKVWANASWTERVITRDGSNVYPGNQTWLGNPWTKWTFNWEIHFKKWGISFCHVWLSKRYAQNHLEISGCQTKVPHRWTLPAGKGARLRHGEENNEKGLQLFMYTMAFHGGFMEKTAQNQSCSDVGSQESDGVPSGNLT